MRTKCATSDTFSRPDSAMGRISMAGLRTSTVSLETSTYRLPNWNAFWK